MHGFLRCVLYLWTTGFLFFLIGRILPKAWFRYDQLPYRLLKLEKDGRVYRVLGVHKWKEKFPDMSAVLPKFMPSKKLPKTMNSAQVKRMVQETCIAELIHSLLCITGLVCVFLWKGIGGISIAVLYALANLPYCIIQRYNRPKLIKIWMVLSAKETNNIKIEEETGYEERADIKLQYGARA